MTSTSSTEYTEQDEVERCKARIAKALDKSFYVYTLTRFGRGQTDHVEVYVADPATSRIERLTYEVAKVSGHRMTDKGMPFGGGGYSKGLDAFILTCKAAGLPDAPQARWEELH
jgi:hypothetical protein